jgi:phosphoglycerol transferase MdoB-like AlkP superfamily enzyme
MLATYIPWLLTSSGVLGVVLGVNRTLKRRENESKLLQVISFLVGVILFAAPVAMVLQGSHNTKVSGVSILLMLLLAICLVARALKDLPIAFIVVALLGTGLFWLFSWLKQFNFAGDVPTQTIALVISVLILVVFGASFIIEKTIDLFLGFLSLGLIVFIVAAIALIQGLLTGMHITDQNGLLNLLKG